MGLEGVKVGDEVFHVWNESYPGSVSQVAHVGRQSITTRSGHKFNRVTGYGNVGTPGRIYSSEAAYAEHVRTQSAWNDTRWRITRFDFKSEGMTLDTIQQVRALLGLPAWEK
jgi:Tfp pilus assembly protein PilW